MIMINLSGSSAGTPTRDFSDYLAKEAARDRLIKELRPANKAALFDALSAVPLSTWDYVLGGTSSPPDPRLDRRYGRGAWWAP